MTDTTTLAYRYALLRPLDWADDCDAELRKASDLWNRLVEIERGHREQVREVAASEVADARAAYKAADAAYLEPVRRRKAVSAQARRRVETPDLDAEIRHAHDCRAEAAAKLKDATKRAYQDHREALRALEAQRLTAVKHARQTSRLHWGTYNAVIQAYDAGRQRTLREGASLRFRAFDGTGRITQQIINGMSVAELFEGRKSQVQLGPDPKGKGSKIRSLTVVIYTRHREPRTVTWPIVWHRNLPEDARIQQVSVHKTSRGGRIFWHVVFSLRIPGTPERRESGIRVAINLGWRRTAAGIRVTTVMREGSDAVGHVLLPPAVLQRLERCEHDTATRDREINRIIAWLSTFKPPASTDERVVETINNIVRAPRAGPRALYRLVRIMRAAMCLPPPLVEWYAADRIIWHEREERRAWAFGLRREHYRLAARRWLHDAREIIINEHDMSQTAEIEGNELPAPARAMRVVAAPSEFRRAVIEYAQKAGISVVLRSLKHDICAECGSPLKVADRAALIWQCQNDHVFDQDVNYCRRLLLSSPYAGDRLSDARKAGSARKPEEPRRPGLSGSGRWARVKAARAGGVTNEDLHRVSPARTGRAHRGQGGPPGPSWRLPEFSYYVVEPCEISYSAASGGVSDCASAALAAASRSARTAACCARTAATYAVTTLMLGRDVRRPK
jgi:hypothetical protein